MHVINFLPTLFPYLEALKKSLPRNPHFFYVEKFDSYLKRLHHPCYINWLKMNLSVFKQPANETINFPLKIKLKKKIRSFNKFRVGNRGKHISSDIGVVPSFRSAAH